MGKVLIIAYYFNKDEFVGTVRIRGLAKFLHKFGWHPTILTARTPFLNSNCKINDSISIIETPHLNIVDTWRKRFGILSDKPFKEQLGLKTYKNETNSINRILNLWLEIFAYPDPEKSWYKVAMKECSNLFHNEKFDAVLSTSGPVTSHIIAKSLKIKYGIPWIADFRDPWTQFYSYPYSRFRKFIETRLEVNTIANADLITTVSQPLADKLSEIHKDKKIYVITNGFDPSYTDSIQVPLNDKFNLIYTGNIDNKNQDPEGFFKSLCKLISDKRINPNLASVDFYCRQEWWLENEIKKYGLTNVVHLNGFIPRKSVIRKQQEAQILLLLTWNDPREKGVYTGKIFEYLAAKRPILSFGSYGGVVKDLLETTNAGIHATTEQELVNEILKAYQEFKINGTVSYHGISTEIDKYSHREMARKFSALLDKLASN